MNILSILKQRSEAFASKRMTPLKRSFQFKCIMFGLFSMLLGVIVGFRAAIPYVDIMNYHLKSYQIQCSADSAYVFVNSTLIGSTPWGTDGIDSVILKDNDEQ